MNQKLYRALASVIDARLTCLEKNNEFTDKWDDILDKINKNILPSGSGFNARTTIDLDVSTGEKIVLSTAYHHMNDAGYYTDWTEHNIIIKPSLIFDFTLKITGKDKCEIKDYIHEVFDTLLRETLITKFDTKTNKFEVRIKTTHKDN